MSSPTPTSTTLLVLVGALAALGGAVFACDGQVGSAAGADASAGDASSPEENGATGQCLLTGDQCVGDARCCPPIGAFRVDLKRGCREATSTPFYCQPPQGPAPSPNVKRCGACSDETLCAFREVDGGAPDAEGGARADAALEVFTNSCLVSLPGLAPCDGDLAARAAAASVTVCP